MQPTHTGQTVAAPVHARAVLVGARHGRRVDVEKLTTIAFFLLPAAVVYSIFVLLPVIQAIYYSFFQWNGLGAPTDFVGFDNLIRVLGDTTFRNALSHNIIILVLSIALQLPLAFGLALLVNRGLRGKTVFRTIFFLPYVLSDVITGVVWNFIYKPENGLLNSILGSVIPGFTPQGWLGNPQTVLGALFLVMTWKYFGLHLLLFLAALQDVPRELEEAAAIDGATRPQTILRVIIPLMGNTARLSVYLSALGSLQIFDLVWVMTTGGPVGASDTMATYMYKFGFQRFAIGYGSAVAIAIFVFCLGVSLIYQRASRQREFA
jgi:raffinose/stachyose/melibiose transport system permease protein